eukprot:8301535-Pyramimonas_sp.AAC.1
MQTSPGTSRHQIRSHACRRRWGGAFNGAWSAWARKAAYSQGGAWVNIKSDPRRNTVQQCDEFLQAWSKMGYDAYRMDREYQLHVDWPS